MKRKAPAISKLPEESAPTHKKQDTQERQEVDELPSTNKATPDDNLKKRKKDHKEIIPKSVTDLENAKEVPWKVL